jgi:hypothetical protein
MYFVQIYKTAENSKPLSADANQIVRTHKRILEMYFCIFWIRIHTFLGLQDPDPDPSIIKQK